MSYTPEDQLIDDAADEFLRGADRLLAAFRARLAAPDEWTCEHLQDLTTVHDQLLRMTLGVRNLVRGERSGL